VKFPLPKLLLGHAYGPLLRKFFPAAPTAFADLHTNTALVVLAAAPTPAVAAKLTRANLVALLHDAGRGTRPADAARLVEIFPTTAAGLARQRVRPRRGLRLPRPQAPAIVTDIDTVQMRRGRLLMPRRRATTGEAGAALISWYRARGRQWLPARTSPGRNEWRSLRPPRRSPDSSTKSVRMPEEPASDPFATEKYAKVKQDAAESKAKEDALDAATERRWEAILARREAAANPERPVKIQHRESIERLLAQLDGADAARDDGRVDTTQMIADLARRYGPPPAVALKVTAMAPAGIKRQARLLAAEHAATAHAVAGAEADAGPEAKAKAAVRPTLVPGRGRRDGDDFDLDDVVNHIRR
jgi:hypothetical protein